MRDYYYILGIPKSATEKEIKTAYRKLSLKFHPDKNNGDKFFEERFIQLLEAYEILSDPDKKDHYDDKLNKFNSSQKNRENLKNIEEELKRKFDEEIRRREEEIIRHYQSRENKIKQDYHEKGKTTYEEPENKKSHSKGMSFRQYFLIFFITSIALYLIRASLTNIRNNPKSEIVTDQKHQNVPFNQNQQIQPTSDNSDLKTPNSSTPENEMNSQDKNENESNKLQGSMSQQTSDSIILVLDNNIEVSLSKYPDVLYLTAPKEWSNNYFFDIDGDGLQELLVERFTGGAHCCLLYALFRQISLNKYQLVFKFGEYGNFIGIEKNKIWISFSEQISYFHSCHACNIDEQISEPKIYYAFYLLYKDKEIHFPNIVDESLNEKILKNLNFLRNRELPKLDSIGNDDGTRKFYAKLITSYYFNNNRNLQSSNEIFNKYYLGEDQNLVWSEIQDIINSLLINYCPRVSANYAQKFSPLDFVDNYYQILMKEDYSKLNEIFSNNIVRYYDQYNPSKEWVIDDIINYKKKFKVNSVRFLVNRNSVQASLSANGNYIIKFEMDYILDRQNQSKKSYFHLNIYMEVDQNEKLISLFENILKKA